MRSMLMSGFIVGVLVFGMQYGVAYAQEEEYGDMDLLAEESYEPDNGVATMSESPTQESANTASTSQASSATTDIQKLNTGEFIDTIDIGAEGNWLRKRKWYELAQALYEQISTSVDQVLALRLPFFVKRSDVDRSVLDPFYLSIGLDRRELEEAINALIAMMNIDREQQGGFDVHERALYDTLQKEKNAVEQLQKDIDGILSMDHKIDADLDELMTQMDNCRKWQYDAWTNFKDIAKELSDVKAEELYYRMQASQDSVLQMQNWIQTVFATHFDGLIQSVSEQTAQIKAAVAQLKEKGIDLKTQVQRVDEQAEKERLENERLEAEEKAKAEAEAQKSWISKAFGAVQSSVAAVWHWIADSVSSVVHWVGNLFGFGEQDVASDDEEQASEQEPAPVASAQPDQGNIVTDIPVVTQPVDMPSAPYDSNPAPVGEESQDAIMPIDSAIMPAQPEQHDAPIEQPSGDSVDNGAPVVVAPELATEASSSLGEALEEQEDVEK